MPCIQLAEHALLFQVLEWMKALQSNSDGGRREIYFFELPFPVVTSLLRQCDRYDRRILLLLTLAFIFTARAFG